MSNPLLSFPNTKVNSFIEQIKDDVDSGMGLKNNMSHDYLGSATRTK